MDSKDQILEKVYDLAFKYEAERGSCPQCVLSALHKTLDISDPATIQASDALAGGCALSTQGTCGALVGGSMVIGYLFGRELKDFSNMMKPLKSYKLVKELHDQYLEKYGACRCHDVQKSFTGRTWNLWDMEELKKATKPGGLLDYCPELVGNVAKLATKIISENGFKPKV